MIDLTRCESLRMEHIQLDADSNKQWDPVEHLETVEDVAVYLNIVLEENELGLVMVTLGDIARAQKIALVARRPV